jgi:hypothetical protein
MFVDETILGWIVLMASQLHLLHTYMVGPIVTDGRELASLLCLMRALSG